MVALVITYPCLQHQP